MIKFPELCVERPLGSNVKTILCIFLPLSHRLLMQLTDKTCLLLTQSIRNSLSLFCYQILQDKIS